MHSMHSVQAQREGTACTAGVPTSSDFANFMLNSRAPWILSNTKRKEKRKSTPKMK